MNRPRAEKGMYVSKNTPTTEKPIVLSRTSKAQNEVEQVTLIVEKITIEQIEQKVFEGKMLTLVERQVLISCQTNQKFVQQGTPTIEILRKETP